MEPLSAYVPVSACRLARLPAASITSISTVDRFYSLFYSPSLPDTSTIPLTFFTPLPPILRRMYSLFLLYRWFTFAFFVVASAVICSVAAWNLSFAQNLVHSNIVHIDAFLVFLGAAGLVVIFPILFVDVLRKGAISSRIWFEVAWTTLFWIMNFAGAVAVSVVEPSNFCGITVPGVVNLACTSSKVLVVFLWLNTGFIFMYFFMLTIFTIVHQKENAGIWQSGVRDFPWFKTRLCLGSVPSSPVLSATRFSKPKLPSLAAPKPRRPPPIFVAQRAGLGSNIEIEHFPDPGSIEDAPLPSLPPAVSQMDAAVSLYPQHVQASVRQAPTYQPPNNTYYPSRTGPGSSPPPIRDWPRPMGSTSSSTQNRALQMSDKAAGKKPASKSSRNVDRAGSGGSTSSRSREHGASAVAPVRPLPQTRELPQRAAPVSVAPVPPSSFSSSRTRPTGPRTRSESISSANTWTRPRPPPLDLSRNGSTPSVGRR